MWSEGECGYFIHRDSPDEHRNGQQDDRAGEPCGENDDVRGVQAAPVLDVNVAQGGEKCGQKRDGYPGGYQVVFSPPSRFTHTMRTEIAAGVIPGIREAWPSDTGWMSVSFWRISVESPGIHV